MIDGFDRRLRHHLDRLEVRGRRNLLIMARRTALRLALTQAAPACLGGAVLALAWSRIEFLDPIAIVATAILIPVMIVVVVYFWRLPRRPADRRTALALFDHRFGLKDRIVTADQFERAPNRDGFEEAALAEAYPWVDRAVDMPLERPAGPSPRWSWRWLFPASALLVLCLAITIPHRSASGLSLAGEAPQTQERNLSASATTAPSAKRPAPGRATPATGTRPLPDRSTITAAPRLGGLRSIMTARIQSALDALGLGQGGSGTEARAVPPRRGARPNAADAGPGPESVNARAQSENGSQTTTALNRESAGTTPPLRSSESSMRSEETIAPSEAASSGNAGATMRDTSSRRPTPSQWNDPQQSDGDKEQRPGRQRRSDQNSNSREQGGGGSENGRGTGDEADAKKGRGVASLLLALPMRDRLAGMASNGRVAVTTREGRPQAFPAQQARARNLGVNRGDVGAFPYRGDTAHEQRLLSNYFARSSDPGED